MRWFASLLFTIPISLAVAAIIWLRDSTLADLDQLSDIARWILPGSITVVLVRFQFWFIMGLRIVIRIALEWIFAYNVSADDDAPRRSKGTVHSTLFTLFHNPSRWWLSGYLVMMVPLLAATGVYVWWFNRDELIRLLWSLTTLFGATLAATAGTPDRPDLLRDAGIGVIDPRFAIPEPDAPQS